MGEDLLFQGRGFVTWWYDFCLYVLDDGGGGGGRLHCRFNKFSYFDVPAFVIFQILFLDCISPSLSCVTFLFSCFSSVDGGESLLCVLKKKSIVT